MLSIIYISLFFFYKIFVIYGIYDDFKMHYYNFEERNVNRKYNCTIKSIFMTLESTPTLLAKRQLNVKRPLYLCQYAAAPRKIYPEVNVFVDGR